MAVALEELYKEIEPLYDMRLVTNSCFHKIIEWTHVVENPEFIKLLHGNELVFTVGLQYTSEEWLMDFVKQLIAAGAGGLVLSLHDGKKYPAKVVDYCNAKHFPLFSSGWNTPYLDIMRLFASVLLKNEQRETNLSAALKNAIYYPENEGAYIHHFEHNGFYRNMEYIMVVLSCNAYRTDGGNTRLRELAREIQYSAYRNIVVEEDDRLLILVIEQNKEMIKRDFQKLCRSDSQVYVGIGTEVSRLQDLQESYEHAMAAYQLTKTAIATNILVYEELGVYKVLSDLKHPELGESFIQEVLGRLINYDERNGTEYLDILIAFFENDCSILHTAQAIYCHKNTLNYKMNKVKEILGYDIMSNENRTRIMVALYFIKMRA
ncbi:MAG: PucR family transcriptional regulator ligand-binding domain-containing protein [Eubacteriales bacterium]|nr:PucR family transcriptional regulator ligand-binding domain-containing protein [Eubacteriales bacterium]